MVGVEPNIIDIGVRNIRPTTHIKIPTKKALKNPTDAIFEASSYFLASSFFDI